MQSPTTSRSARGWTSTAPVYASSVGRMSALAAAHLTTMAKSLRPLDETSNVLDVGAGTGAVTSHVAAYSPSIAILATDISSGMLSTIDALGLPNVKTSQVDALQLSTGLGRNRYSHAFTTFVLQTIMNPLDVLKEIHAVLVPGGVIGVGLWEQRNDVYDIWERACQSIDPSYVSPPPFEDPQSWRTGEVLAQNLRAAGFASVTCEDLAMPFPFDSAEKFADFWFGSKNPGTRNSIESWKGDIGQVRERLVEVVRVDYDNGRSIKNWAALGVARK